MGNSLIKLRCFNHVGHALLLHRFLHALQAMHEAGHGARATGIAVVAVARRQLFSSTQPASAAASSAETYWISFCDWSAAAREVIAENATAQTATAAERNKIQRIVVICPVSVGLRMVAPSKRFWTFQSIDVPATLAEKSAAR
jgi:hypothetical protein